MNFDLTEDEELLKAAVERFVADRYDAERRRAYQREDAGFSRENWRMLGEMGFIAAPFAEADGGLGLGATAIGTMFEALGRGMVVEPLGENALFATRLFALAAPTDLRGAWLPLLLAGERRIAVAHAEAGGRGGRLWVETRAEGNGRGLRLFGGKPYVVAGAGADAYLVSARARGAPDDLAGWTFHFVPADAPGLVARSWRAADGGQAVALTLEGVEVMPGSQLADGAAALDEASLMADLARAAESLGIMEAMFADTLTYLRTREQFGSPIGKFQAIQHRMVKQYAILAQARALLELAMMSDGKPGFAAAVHGARAYIARAALPLGHEMIQFHGGMGVTDELAIGHGHKRLLMLSRWPDDGEAALDRYAGTA